MRKLWQRLKEDWEGTHYYMRMSEFDSRGRRLRNRGALVFIRVVCSILQHYTYAAICHYRGHDLQDCSSAGPDSGNMDHECVRCGQYWHIPLY